MGGFDDHVANIGDWIPPSPSPSSRAFFSSLLADDFGGWQPHMEETNESTCRNFVVEPQEYVTWCNSDGKDGAGTGATTDQTVKSSAPSEQEMSSRGGLMERMVARAGLNVPRLNTDGLRPPVMSQNQEVKSPYLSIAAGLSPSILLYSPVLLYNPLVYPSPTTGLLPCATGESNNLMLTTEAANKRKEIAFGSNNSSSLSFNSIMETGRVNPSCQIEVSVHPNNSLQPQSTEATQNERICHETTDFPVLSTEEDVGGSDMIPEVRTINVVGDSMEHSPSLDEKQDEGTYGDASVEDGYNWRKYGQNQVKGSEYPRSYYKCTHPNCLVKKEIGRYHKGHVMEIIYNGAHNHPKPLPNRISALGSSNSFGNMQLDNVDPTGTGVNGELALETIQQGHIAGGLEGKNDNLDETSLANLHSEYCRGSTTLHSNQLESADVVDISSTFSNDEDDRGTHGSASVGCDGEVDESESKTRKIELDETDTSGASKPIREQRVVVQTISEIDIINDGYRWRKYGQKMVKGNPYPRSYYKCTNPGCNIRKHIERAPFDLKSVITTYGGKHNHDAPVERKSSHASSGISKSRSNPKTTNAKGHVCRPEPTQTKNTSKRYGRAPPFGSFGPTSGFNSSKTNQQQVLTGLAMTRFNSDQHQFSVPVNPHTRWPQPVNDAGFTLPEGEPMPDPSLNYSNASSTYQEVMNGLPPGPQM